MDKNIISEYNQIREKHTYNNAPKIYQNYLFEVLSDTFKNIIVRPQVDTGLGFYVDGGKDDLENFRMGKKYTLPFVIDIEGHKHYINQDKYDIIIEKIETNGIKLYQWKWDMKSKIYNISNQEEFDKAEQEIKDKI